MWGKKVRIKVVKILEGGNCNAGLKPGAEFVSDGSCPPGFCGWAFHDIYPEVTTLRFGGNFPWMKKDGVIRACCTDGMNPVLFDLERIED